MSIGDTIKNFNKTLLSLASQISVICPQNIVSSNVSTIDTIINRFPEKVIEQFIIYVLPDKDKIDNGDENYFLNKDYSKVIKDKKKGDLINDIFQFKEIWKELSNNNKKMVINYMKCLCYFAQVYLISRT